MPKVKRSRKPPPDGWELIEPTLDELDQKMREAETEPHEGKRKVESLWPIFRLHHQRSRYIFDLFYKRKAISRELYDYCIKEGYADKNLIAKWKKQGYENLCCLRCIQTRDTNFGTNCICRVPKGKLEVLYDYCIKEGYADKNLIAKWKKQGYENLCCLRCIQTRDTNFGTNCICRVPKGKLEVGRIIECTHCGCRGCSG
ncbi:hypothetical protein PGIGA_G00143130 [Pangasianodon gigas]|uniref:Uncharacterized protein n=1 Tax=Pangasianodon gigas TaxID=30993 RepID=A0ACC5XM57_PANGG|nr:hypothetical protein [Pangasianodon gigas]